MKIAGINKTSLLDYPEKVAATVFTAGCNFCCPFCHNRDLVIGPTPQLINEDSVLDFLGKRRGILGGVCISGGEPTIDPDLIEFIGKIKAMGYCVKLDTNGYQPTVVRQLLADRLIDYIAMDIKNCRERYSMTAGRSELDISRIEESVKLIKEAGIPYEFRTTVVKELHSESDIMTIGNWLGEGSRWFLQNYEEHENVICAGFHPHSPEQLHYWKKWLEDNSLVVAVRGIA
ncbi:MAG: anaerobic ribonucleoside-triphosphate reductase activating protein [Lachnospiraceae bacterium]|jgi:pyruvate formate lyase activating enzyme|nr:anaerobic ribonucleoside-triphosphate reductase activating protein [Lachnospiraceae bacterium]